MDTVIVVVIEPVAVIVAAVVAAVVEVLVEVVVASVVISSNCSSNTVSGPDRDRPGTRNSTVLHSSPLKKYRFSAPGQTGSGREQENQRFFINLF